MENIPRRKFLVGSASAILTLYFGPVRIAQAQVYNLGGFWRRGVKVVAIRTTQVIGKAAVLDVSYRMNTTQSVAKAAVLDTSFRVSSSTVVTKAAVLAQEYKMNVTSVVVKVLVRV